MPLDTVTAFRCYEFSEDAGEGHSFLIGLMTGARVSLHLRIFGFTDPDLAAAFLDAYRRGVSCWLIVDHLQAIGPVAKKLIAGLIAGGFPPDRVCITSDYGGGFMHEKVLVVDGAADVPDGQYPDVDAAAADGYPIVCTGSTNWTHTAFYSQSNHLLVLPGKLFAARCLTEFAALFTYGRSRYPQYQIAAPESGPGDGAAV